MFPLLLVYCYLSSCGCLFRYRSFYCLFVFHFFFASTFIELPVYDFIPEVIKNVMWYCIRNNPRSVGFMLYFLVVQLIDSAVIFLFDKLMDNSTPLHSLHYREGNCNLQLKYIEKT